MPYLRQNPVRYPQDFKENSKRVYLNCTLVDQYKTELNALVTRRNEIAHGKQMIIKDLKEYKK
ncbi:MAG: hypothetical protein F6J96_28905 [Symploca sp. SIO1C2]|nr:hypothetical protein [Symploca sp. SIO1C2]